MTSSSLISNPTIAIILAFNEELHIERAIVNAFKLADMVYVIDAFSTDRTRTIAEGMGALVLQKSWTSHAGQFNWALAQLPSNTGWVIRLDADEYVDDTLALDFHRMKLKQHNGLVFNREIQFCGNPIRFGGLFPIKVIRAFRYGKGFYEQRLMDEHILVDGSVGHVDGLLTDQNLNSLDWWTEKHNRYASLEAIEILDNKFQFLNRENIGYGRLLGRSASVKRWIKNSIYLRLPYGFRARAYYFYRTYLRLGILGTSEERTFHFLQGLWYRYLVDAKVAEVERYMRIHRCEIREAIYRVLRLKI